MQSLAPTVTHTHINHPKNALGSSNNRTPSLSSTALLLNKWAHSVRKSFWLWRWKALWGARINEICWVKTELPGWAPPGPHLVTLAPGPRSRNWSPDNTSSRPQSAHTFMRVIQVLSSKQTIKSTSAYLLALKYGLQFFFSPTICVINHITGDYSLVS